MRPSRCAWPRQPAIAGGVRVTGCCRLDRLLRLNDCKWLERLRTYDRGLVRQYADERNLRGLLRIGRQRPHAKAQGERDNRPPVHSMTSSARARIVCGMVRPSAPAVLITSSNFVGCSTGVAVLRHQLTRLASVGRDIGSIARHVHLRNAPCRRSAAAYHTPRNRWFARLTAGASAILRRGRARHHGERAPQHLDLSDHLGSSNERTKGILI
jgi:hypothetical protein